MVHEGAVWRYRPSHCRVHAYDLGYYNSICGRVESTSWAVRGWKEVPVEMINENNSCAWCRRKQRINIRG